MSAFFEEFKHLKIQLEDIKLATNNFSDNNLLGKGGFGNVYKGLICHSKGQEFVAFKRLDSRYGQGNSEFWREIMMLSRYTHKNLISLLGYCDEADEKILVYELASRGSLDNHLSDPTLTWKQRLQICLATAKGLNYLHDPKGLHERVLHRDIKSSNILLDENWNSKISDLGLSKMGPANQRHSVLITNIVGTIGYLDPQYLEMGMLTKESDVYSFGVVLFEVLCGKLCFSNKNGEYQTSVRMWKKSYIDKKLDEIIFQDLKQQMDPSSLEIFSDIAYQCIHEYREERPTMSLVVKKLESALNLQEIYESRIGFKSENGPDGENFMIQPPNDYVNSSNYRRESPTIPQYSHEEASVIQPDQLAQLAALLGNAKQLANEDFRQSDNNTLIPDSGYNIPQTGPSPSLHIGFEHHLSSLYHQVQQRFKQQQVFNMAPMGQSSQENTQAERDADPHKRPNTSLELAATILKQIQQGKTNETLELATTLLKQIQQGKT
ncbi:probable serine/threonine-protein kinase PBL28 [Rutidosis leptorrhynchoides]|uniref:probable serine/threonine-protein kinase PBL28 n=1 Tax=Rutidosis leptorrhynchoides TaxID=125765 RepID=UPI003A9A0CEB